VIPVILQSAVVAGYAVRAKKRSHEVLDDIRRQKIDAGLQPVRLVKYFSFSSLGVILVFTLFLSWFISNHARIIMLEQSEEYSVAFAENLNQQVFRRFVVITALRYGAIKLSNPDQFNTLDRIIRQIIQGMNVESVTIYDSKINVISYSTIQERVGKKDVGGIEYERARQGTTNSKIITSGSVLNLFPQTEPVSCRLITYIPFRQVSPSGKSGEIIMGVIEIVKDLSSDYRAIIRLQGIIIFVSSAVMMILFIVLRIIVMNATKKLEERIEERLQLEEKLNQSERLAHLGSMVATVSHEIKSPLGIIRSTSEILERRIRKVAPGNEHLARIIDKVEDKERMSVCLDTCHVFAAGYKLQDIKDYKATIKEFDQTVGLNKLKIIHFNDSKKPFGSKKDRHEHLGQGELGEEPFRNIMNDRRMNRIPKILETPKSDDLHEDIENLNFLRSLVDKK